MILQHVGIVCAMLVMMVASAPKADTIKTVAVVPFAINSAEEIRYIRDGIDEMLVSRISSGGKVKVISAHETRDALGMKDSSSIQIDDVFEVGKKLQADYVVWGTITKIGSMFSIDGKIIDISTRQIHAGIFTEMQSLDNVIPTLNDLAARTVSFIVTGHAVPGTDSSSQEKRTAIPEPCADEGISAAFNPQIIAASTTIEKKGFWMSEQFGVLTKGFDIGDVNGDGQNEVVVIEAHEVIIYVWREKKLQVLKTIPGSRFDNYIAVDVADINGNGIGEIFVTNIRGSVVSSFVIEYAKDDFAEIASELKWFLRVIGSSVEPVLLGQKKGIDIPFSENIYRIVWRDDRYEEDTRMPVPEGITVYGMTIDILYGGGMERCIAFEEHDHLCVYATTKRPVSQIHILGGSEDLIWKSDEIYGGSSNYFNFGGNNLAGYGVDYPDNIYVKLRILTVDMNHDGKKEVLVARNISSLGTILKNVKMFTVSELYNLEWSGIGLKENWRTQKIQGSIADYHYKDIDNDGKNEVVLVLNLAGPRSIVVAYDM